MALHKGLADGLFAALVRPGGVEVGEAGGKELVDHLLGLLDVDGALLALRLGLQLRQAHEAKAELLDVRSELGFLFVGGHWRSLPSPMDPPLADCVHGKRIALATGPIQAGESRQTKTAGQLGCKGLHTGLSRA